MQMKLVWVRLNEKEAIELFPQDGVIYYKNVSEEQGQSDQFTVSFKKFILMLWLHLFEPLLSSEVNWHLPSKRHWVSLKEANSLSSMIS